MKSLWLMPGQGSQKAGMLVKVRPQAKKEAEELLGIKLLDTESAYQDSVQIQLSILLVQLDQIDRLKELGWQPDLVAGHSLGIFGAAYAAGVIEKQDVLKLVQLRATLMQDAYPVGYGMGAVVGMVRKDLQKLVEQVNDTAEPVYLSNQNSELQNTVSGKLTAIQKVLNLAKENGALKTKILKVPNPSHSPLMAEVATKLNTFLKKIELHIPQSIYLTNYDGHATKSLEKITFDLGNNLVYPVYWETMMQVALEYGVDISCEFSPGTAFTKLLRAKNNRLRNVTLATMSVDDVDYLFNKWRKV